MYIFNIITQEVNNFSSLVSPTGSYASSAELSRCSSQLSEEDYGGEYGERDPYDENDSYHSCHSSVSYSKGSPDWDETQGAYSDEGGYSKDGGEEVALYEGDDGGLYEGEEEGLYEDEMMYDDEDLYNLDGTLSEDMEPPFTPTPTSTAPPSLDVSGSRPPLEKQSSLHQQEPLPQTTNQTSSQAVPPGMAPTVQPPTGQQTTQPPKQQQPQTQPQPQPAPSATSFFSMAKPLTAAVTGLASSFLSSVPAAQPPQTQSPASAVSQQHQTVTANSLPPSHPATLSNSQLPSTATGPSSQQTPSTASPQAHVSDPSSTQSAAAEEKAPNLEDEMWLEEEMMEEKEVRTPPAQHEEKLPVEQKEEHIEESRSLMPEEPEEIPPER